MAVGTCCHVIRIERRRVLPACLDQLQPTRLGCACKHGLIKRAYLFGLAFEAFLRVVWPPSRKGRFPRLDHGRIKRMYLPIASQPGFNCCHQRPPACWRVFQVLLQRVVVRFPPIERLCAEEADHIIRALGMRLEEESGFGELGVQCISKVSSAAVKGNANYLDRRQRLVRPDQSLGDSALCNGLRTSKRGETVLVNKVLLVNASHCDTRCWRHVGATALVRFAVRMAARDGATGRRGYDATAPIGQRSEPVR